MTILDEKQIAEYMVMFEKNPDAYVKFVLVEIKDMNETLVSLWKVARAAKKWINAAPGAMSVDAETELVIALDGLKQER